ERVLIDGPVTAGPADKDLVVIPGARIVVIDLDVDLVPLVAGFHGKDAVGQDGDVAGHVPLFQELQGGVEAPLLRGRAGRCGRPRQRAHELGEKLSHERFLCCAAAGWVRDRDIETTGLPRLTTRGPKALLARQYTPRPDLLPRIPKKLAGQS